MSKEHQGQCSSDTADPNLPLGWVAVKEFNANYHSGYIYICIYIYIYMFGSPLLVI